VQPEANLRDEVNAYLAFCYRHHTPPHVSELAVMLKVSRYTLTTRFRRQYGVPLVEYFKCQQIACSKRLLKSTKLSVAAVARRAAFSSERSFHRAFLRETGTTPAEYRRRFKRVA